MPALVIAIDMARDKVEKNARDAITGLVPLTNYFTSVIEPAGTRCARCGSMPATAETG